MLSGDQGNGVAVDAFGGATLLDRYVLVRPLAAGGMGAVWLGKDRKLGGPVAIKFLTRPGEASQARFLEEARIAARLTSPHIVRVFDVGTHLASPFLVMEYLEGETLEERLLATGPLSPELTVSVLGQVASGLTVAHAQGIVHRDLKPANTFLTNTGSGVVAKILDFGVAKVDTTLRTGSGEILGTPHYLSPEQVADASSVDPRSDLWSLAVIAYECVTGRRPFSARSMVELLRAIEGGDPPPPTSIAAVPPALDTWFARAIARDPDRRFQTARELVTTLQAALCPQGTGTVASGALESLERTWEASDGEPQSTLLARTTRARRLALLVGSAVVVTALGGWWSWSSGENARPAEQQAHRPNASASQAPHVIERPMSATLPDADGDPQGRHLSKDVQPIAPLASALAPDDPLLKAAAATSVRASSKPTPRTRPSATPHTPSLPAKGPMPEQTPEKSEENAAPTDEDLWGVRR